MAEILVAEQYLTRWNEDGEDTANVNEHVLVVDTLAQELGLENQQFYFKAGETSMKTYDQRTEETISMLEDGKQTDNVRVLYSDDERQMLMEYDSGTFGDQYRIAVTGDEDFKERVETSIEHELSEKGILDTVPVLRAARDGAFHVGEQVQEYYDDYIVPDKDEK